jgi:hypothetical protein
MVEVAVGIYYGHGLELERAEVAGDFLGFRRRVYHDGMYAVRRVNITIGSDRPKL